MSSSYIPIVVNLTGVDVPQGMTSANFIASGNAIQAQANDMLALGGSMDNANAYVANALHDLSTNGVNSSYYTTATSPLTATIASDVAPYLPGVGAASLGITTASKISDLKNWSISRAASVIVGIIMIFGAIMMFAMNKTDVINIASSVVKNPEVLA